MLDVIGMGESMVAFEAQSFGPLREAEDFKKWVGGAADNYLIALARLGFSCGFFSRVGDDELGRFITRWIRGEGIDVSRTCVDSSKPTGIFIVERRTPESNFKCYFYRSNSAATNLCPDDVDEAYVSQARVVYPEAMLAYISDSARRAVERLFDIAVKHKQTIVFDPNLRLTMCSVEESRAIHIPLMQKATYVIPGADELQMLMDRPDVESAIEQAHSLCIDKIIVKSGAAGAILAVKGQEMKRIPSFALKKPVSPMGAGDCFVGGFTAGLLKGQPLETCVRWGHGVGAFSTMAYGPFHGCPSMDELMKFLAGKEEISR
jgi:2-dehydro-3-deoxygluconokinase